MGLFNRLLAHQRGAEDYFTEIVAYLLRETEGLLFDWLAYLKLAASDDYVDFSVTTQASHDEGRPDIMIVLSTADGANDWIFVESKLDSAEGPMQLSRYAQALVRQSAARRRHLLYVTRDFDPKDAQSVLKGVPAGLVNFRQLRWSDFYHFLETRRDDRLIDESCVFMEAMHMAQSNQFSPNDMLAMSRLPQVFGLMNETLYGEVSRRFEEVVGEVSSEPTTIRQLAHNRYTLTGAIFDKGACMLGYFFRGHAYPKLGVFLEMHPGNAHQDQVLAMMRELDGQGQWIGYRLNQAREWPRIEIERSLNSFVATEDHVAAVKQGFLELLDEVMDVKGRYPHLPWRVAALIEDSDGAGPAV